MNHDVNIKRIHYYNYLINNEKKKTNPMVFAIIKNLPAFNTPAGLKSKILNLMEVLRT